MVFLVYDSKNILRCVSQAWPMARSALDTLVAEDTGCPRLEIHQDSDYGLDVTQVFARAPGSCADSV